MQHGMSCLCVFYLVDPNVIQVADFKCFRFVNMVRDKQCRTSHEIKIEQHIL